MHYRPVSLYSKDIPNLEERISSVIEKGCNHSGASRKIELFFRADDIAVPSKLFTQLIRTFQHHQMPLCLAVVPSWISPKRYSDLREVTGHDDALWGWHQHGRLHKNFESSGKKQEFGPARDYQSLYYQISLGQERLQSILEDSLDPYFTPPWNRCSLEAAKALKDRGFRAVSRFSGAKPECSHILPDLQVNVDLHTLKGDDPTAIFDKLLSQLEIALASRRCGIMIHHQRMNVRAFRLLDILLRELNKRSEITPLLFRQMV